MKKFSCLLLALFLGASVLGAQTAKEIAKEHKEITKQSQAELNKKASKVARKEAKKLAKEGWTVAPGQLPLEKQLDRAFLMQSEFDADNYPKYIIGEAMTIGENYDAALVQAQELAKINLAGKIQTEVVALVESSIANKELAADEAASISETVMASKNLISQSLGRVIPIVQCYRIKNNKNKEVLVRIAYDTKSAKEAARNIIRKELEKKGQDLQDKLDKALTPDYCPAK